MRFLKIFFLLWFALPGTIITCDAQQASFTLAALQKTYLPGDTIFLEATYALEGKAIPPATLSVILKQDSSNLNWWLRWPLLKGSMSSAIILPKNIPHGSYTFYYAVQPRFFKVYGQVLSPPGLSMLNANIIDENGNSNNFDLPLDRGTFTLKNILFYNKAILNLGSLETKQPVAIRMEAVLDSGFTPAATGLQQIGIGTAPAPAFTETDKAFEKVWPLYDVFYKEKLLQHLPPQVMFDSLYVTQIFKKNTVEVFNFLDPEIARLANDFEGWLKKIIPGFKLSADEDANTVMAQSKQYNYAIFLNEQLTTLLNLSKLKSSDLALVKILNLVENPVGDNKKPTRILALYTRRGSLVLPDFYNHFYYLNGYTSPEYVLPYL